MGKIKDIAELLQIKVTSLLEKQSQTPTSHTNVQDLHDKCARHKDHKKSTTAMISRNLDRPECFRKCSFPIDFFVNTTQNV